MTDLLDCIPPGFPEEAIADGGEWNRTYWAKLDPREITAELLEHDDPIARNLAAHRAGRAPITAALSRLMHDAEVCGCRIVSVLLDEPFRDQLHWGKPESWYPVRALLSGDCLPDQEPRPFHLSPLVDDIAQPPSGNVALALAQSLLAKMDYSEGFKAYEYRWQTPHGQEMWRPYPMPMWDGKQSGHVLVWQAQGYGDTFMFCRYLQCLPGGTRGTFLCSPDIQQIIEAEAGRRVYVTSDLDMNVEYDFHIPVCSLPLAPGMTARPFVPEKPYLRPDPIKPLKFYGGYSPFGWNIGICWAGRSTHVNNQSRTITIEQLLKHVNHGATLYNLQHGEAAAQFEKIPAWERKTKNQSLKNWNDTAALIYNLDAVVTVDTAVAHLAGAMGKPVKLILAGSDDWRWKGGQVWYPSIQLVK